MFTGFPIHTATICANTFLRSAWPLDGRRFSPVCHRGHCNIMTVVLWKSSQGRECDEWGVTDTACNCLNTTRTRHKKRLSAAEKEMSLNLLIKREYCKSNVCILSWWSCNLAWSLKNVSLGELGANVPDVVLLLLRVSLKSNGILNKMEWNKVLNEQA